MVDHAGKANGLQGLAFCVGNIALKPLRQAKAEDYVNCFNLNLTSAAMALKYAEPYLKKVLCEGRLKTAVSSYFPLWLPAMGCPITP